MRASPFQETILSLVFVVGCDVVEVEREVCDWLERA